MTRRNNKIEKIENNSSRKVTFSKRRSGLIRKARKLCSLSDAHIAIVTFSLVGRPFSFGHPSVDSIVDHFLANDSSNSSNESVPSSSSSSSSKDVAGKEGLPWWQLPIEGMDLDLDGLQQYKTSLEVLKSNVANRLEEMKEREARTRDFIGLLDAP